MPRPRYAPNLFYHIYNRGVEKRDIVLDNRDRARFIHDLYEFNDRDAVFNLSRRTDVRDPISFIKTSLKKRKRLIDIVAFCLMPNHYHLLLRQRVENGISLFMQKLGIGYTMFFNLRYERNGVLFQGKYKVVSVDKDSYLKHLIRYIHLNPLDLLDVDWRRGDIRNRDQAERFLSDYRWSSHLDYLGKKNFPSLLQRDSLPQYFADIREYQAFLRDWTQRSWGNIQPLTLES